MDHQFQLICETGNLEEVKKLYDENNINIHDKYETPLYNACIKGHLEIVKWMFTLENKPNINSNVVIKTCYHGKLNIIQYLYSIDNNIILNNIDMSFHESCIQGHLELAKWLYNSFDIKPNIHLNRDKAFILSCFFNKIDIVKWLLSICDKYYVEIENGKIKNWKVKTELDSLYEKKEFDKIAEKLNIKKEDFHIDKDESCNICYSNHNFLTSCKHTYCFECFLTWYLCHKKKKCSLCKQDIKLEDCCYLSI